MQSFKPCSPRSPKAVSRMHMSDSCPFFSPSARRCQRSATSTRPASAISVSLSVCGTCTALNLCDRARDDTAVYMQGASRPAGIRLIAYLFAQTSILDHVFKQLLRFSRLLLPPNIASTVISSIGESVCPGTRVWLTALLHYRHNPRTPPSLHPAQRLDGAPGRHLFPWCDRSLVDA